MRNSGWYAISSADWMPRNFDRRVECAVPVEDAELHARLMALLEICLADNGQAWELSSDGGYAQRAPLGAAERATHQTLLKDSWGCARKSEPVPASAEIATVRSSGLLAGRPVTALHRRPVLVGYGASD